MANSVSLSRTHLIFGVCVPLAVLLGYYLAQPLESDSMAIVVLVMSVLCVPLLMKWHYPLLILSWNAAINPFFLPGRPYLWMLIAIISLFFSMVNRAIDSNRRFQRAPQVVYPLLFIGLVVVITAYTTGGFGVRALGSENYGGRRYYYILLAIVGFFALIAQRIPVHRSNFYVAMFFLSGLTAVVSNVAYSLGPKFYFLFELFPAGPALAQAEASEFIERQGMFRLGGMVWAATSIFCVLLARYGVRGILDLTRPWRLPLFIAAMAAGMLGGFRSLAIIFGLTIVTLFWLERLHKTYYVLVFALATVVLGGLLITCSEKLPFPMQRALSFLPIKVEPAARQDAEYSTQWRLDMWREIWPEVPRHLFKGKGYALNAQSFYLEKESELRGLTTSTRVAALTSNFHNGPLSLLIPFGLYGLVGFVWFIIAGFWVLYRNYRYGDERLTRINTFLLGYYVVKGAFFFVAFGSVEGDLAVFTGILGLSIALNGGVRREKDLLEEAKNEHD